MLTIYTFLFPFDVITVSYAFPATAAVATASADDGFVFAIIADGKKLNNNLSSKLTLIEKIYGNVD